jgi:hypothetical protein
MKHLRRIKGNVTVSLASFLSSGVFVRMQGLNAKHVLLHEATPQPPASKSNLLKLKFDMHLFIF